MRKSLGVHSAKLCNVTCLADPDPINIGPKWDWVANDVQGGPQVLQRNECSLSCQERQSEPPTIYSTVSRCQHKLPFTASTPYVAFLRADKSLLLVALIASSHDLFGQDTLRLQWYIMDLMTGLCELQVSAATYWPAWLPITSYDASMCHSRARRILSFATPSTIIVTDADDLQKIACFDVSPSQMQLGWQTSSWSWSADGSKLVVSATCSFNVPINVLTCSIHVFDVASRACLVYSRLPAPHDSHYHRMTTSWSPSNDLLAVDILANAKDAPGGEVGFFYDVLLVNVVTKRHAWTSTMGVPQMQRRNYFCPWAWLECSPDGRLAVIGVQEICNETGFVLVVDAQRLEHVWSHDQACWHSWQNEHGACSWTTDGLDTILNMPGRKHQLCIHQQGDAFILTNIHCDVGPDIQPEAISVRPEHKKLAGYCEWTESPAPLPPSWSQLSACFAFEWSTHWRTQQRGILPSHAKLDLVVKSTGQVVGSWTMASLLKKAGLKNRASWWRMPSDPEDFLVASMTWSPDASHLLVKCQKFFLVLAFDTHLSC